MRMQTKGEGGSELSSGSGNGEKDGSPKIMVGLGNSLDIGVKKERGTKMMQGFTESILKESSRFDYRGIIRLVKKIRSSVLDIEFGLLAIYPCGDTEKK